MADPQNVEAAMLALHARIQQLEAQAQPGRDNLKPIKPSNFSASARDRRELEDWLFSVDAYFNAIGGVIPDDRRIAYVSGLLTGDARKWFRTSQHLLQQPGVTFDNFKAAFRTAFVPVNAGSNARDRLDDVRQTTSVLAYNAAFRSVLLEVPSSDPEDILHRYVKGLKPRIQTQVKLHNPATLDEAMTAADTADRVTVTGQGGNGNRYSGRPAYTARYHGPTPMELGAVRATEGFGRRLQPPEQHVKTRLTPQERDYLLANNGCVYCRRLGHTVRDCRARPANPANAAIPSLQSGKGYRRRP